MKKAVWFGVLVGVSALTGTLTAYTVTRLAVSERDEFVQRQEIPARFTSNHQSGCPDLVYAAERAVPTVVNIEKKEQVRTRAGSGQNPFFEFFGIPMPSPEEGSFGEEQRSGGSGVILSPDGYIVSNYHVVQNASELKVTLNDKRAFTAKVIGTDPSTDLALIKIDATDLPAISFGNSDDLHLGEWVLAIGNPFNLTSTVTAGIVSAKARNLDVINQQFRIESFIQTDAAVNPGNSGGALVNTQGELVGINTVIKSPTGTYAGYSFAVPSSIVKKVIQDLKEYGAVQRAMLGISIQEIDNDFLERMGKETGIKTIGGVYVAELDPEGAAQAAGIKKGDVILSINDTPIAGGAQLQEMIAQYRPKDRVKVSVKRAGNVKQFEVVLRNRAGNTEVVKREVVDVFELLGGKFVEVSEKAKKNLKIQGGAQVVSVGEGLLMRARVKSGYIITHINERPIRTISDLNKITSKVVSIDGIYPDGRVVSYSLLDD